MLWFVVGYIRFKLKGDNITAFFEACRQNNITLKNIHSFSGEYYADALGTQMKKILQLSQAHCIDIKVSGHFGVAMKFFVYKNRVAFFAAFIIFLLSVFLNSFFIKDVVITGNNYLTNVQLDSVLKECGIYPGRFILSVEPEKVQDSMLRKCSRLSWVWVDIKGTVARVELREKISKPEAFDKNFACNIVAERDGVITEAISEAGTLYAKAGTYVQKGDLLIGGVYDSNEYAPVRFVHATGKVLAKTYYGLHGDFPLSYTKYNLAQSTDTAFGINFCNNQIKTHVSGENNIKIMSNEKIFNLFGKFSLPLGFTKEKYCEIISKECVLDKEQAAQMALDELKARLNAQIPSDAKVVNTFEEVSENADGSLCVNLTFECIEDITTELPIDNTEVLIFGKGT